MNLLKTIGLVLAVLGSTITTYATLNDTSFTLFETGIYIALASLGIAVLYAMFEETVDANPSITLNEYYFGE